jgi:Stage II sporulation protein E (SpoIIE)
MRTTEDPVIDVGALLHRVETYPPIDAVHAVTAGHVLPLRLRDGRVEEIRLDVEVPFGVLPDKRFEVQDFPLRAGDRIVFLTDGMQERNAASLDVDTALAGSAGLHPRELVQDLGAAVLRATGGDLRDDATMVRLDWYGGQPRGRSSQHGADPGIVSGPVPGSGPS